MTSKQAFGVAVRSIGVFWMAYGVTTFGFCFFATKDYSALNYAFGASASFLVGMFLMLKADRVVKLCYTTYDDLGYPTEDRAE